MLASYEHGVNGSPKKKRHHDPSQLGIDAALFQQLVERF